MRDEKGCEKMKTFRTLACPKIFWYTLYFPILFFSIGILVLIATKNPLSLLFCGVGVIIWLFYFLRYKNAYSVSSVSSKGVSNRHVFIEWKDSDDFLVATSWANTIQKARTGRLRRPINAKCIYFGQFKEKSIRNQNVRKCVILPANERIIYAIKLFRPDIFKKIITDLRLEGYFDDEWNARRYGE